MRQAVLWVQMRKLVRDPAQSVCTYFMAFSFHCWSFHNGCSLVLLPLTVCLLAGIKICVKLTDIMTNVVSTAFSKKSNMTCSISYVLNAILIREGVTVTWRVSSQGVMGRSQLVQDLGESPV